MPERPLPVCAPPAPSSSAAEAARYDRERAAHNKYFSDHTRKSAEKFYRVIDRSRVLYERVMLERCAGGLALEYGCGMGSHSLFLATRGAAHVTGIDLSDVAIVKATDAARARGIANVEYRTMNAEALAFADDSFDLVCGTAILHHLDLTRAYSELARTLDPRGAAVFMEPLGHNPLINLYRRATPHLRTVDEHPLMMRDLALASRHFRTVRPYFFGLQSFAALPFYGTRAFKPLLRGFEAADAALFRSLPFVTRYAWQVILLLEDPIKHGAGRRG